MTNSNIEEKQQEFRRSAEAMAAQMGVTPEQDPQAYQDFVRRSELEFENEWLMNERNYYRDLVQEPGTIIMRMDINGKILFLNEYGLRFFGYSEDELVGHNLVGTIAPDTESSGRNLHQMFERFFAMPDQFVHNINENICKDGRRVWIAWSNKPVYDEEGWVSEFICVGMDIDPVKQQLETLKRSNRHLKGIIGAFPDGLISVNLQGEIVSYSKSFSAMWKTDPELFAERDIDTVFDYIAQHAVDPPLFRQQLAVSRQQPGMHQVKLRNGRQVEWFCREQQLSGRRLGWLWSFRRSE